MECRNRSDEAALGVRFDLDTPLELAIVPTGDGGCRVRVMSDGVREFDLSSVLDGYASALTLLGTIYRVGEAIL